MAIFRGQDYPLLLKRTGGSPDPKWFYLSRIQEFSADKTQNAEQVYEIGTDGAINATTDAARFSGSVSWTPISMAMFYALAGLAPDAVTASVDLADMMDHGGIELHGKSVGIKGASPQSLNFSVAVRQPVTATAQFRGDGILKAGSGLVTLDSIVTANAETIYHEDGDLRFKHTGSAAAGAVKNFVADQTYTAQDITVKIGAGGKLLRAQRVNITAGFNIDETEEMGYDGVVDTRSNTPTVSATIDFLDASDTPEGAIPFESPLSLIIEFGTEFKITLENMFSTTEGVRAQVRGYATRQFTYMIKSAPVSGGMIIATI